MYAVGKIPGGLKKRKASQRQGDYYKPFNRQTHTPAFPKRILMMYRLLPQHWWTPTYPEALAMIGSSVALTISDIPFNGPTGSVVVGYVDGEYVINPDNAQREKSLLNLTVSGTKDAIMMVEAGAMELEEEIVLKGILFGHEEIKKIVAFIEDIQKEIGKEKIQIDYKLPAEIEKQRDYSQEKIASIYQTFIRNEREKIEDQVTKELMDHLRKYSQ